VFAAMCRFTQGAAHGADQAGSTIACRRTNAAAWAQTVTFAGKTMPPQSGLQQMCLEMRPELKRFLLARGCGPSDADDVLQDLYIRIETTTTGPIRTPRAYLYQMANNLAHTRRRTEKRRQARDAGWIDAHQSADEADKTPDAETALGDRDELARVEAHLRALPERTAFIFRQYRIEGVSQKAIADELGISLSAVEKHLQRAYKAVVAIREERDGFAATSAPQEGTDR
jgi:RNA polymerase sigma-70 factor (ECF subfamily)